MLFAVHSAMTDARYPGQTFWGYAWDIKDIETSGAGAPLQLQVAFVHNHVAEDDPNWRPSKEQQRIPFVLFTGTTTQPDMTVNGPLTFERLSVKDIQRRTMDTRNTRHQKDRNGPISEPHR